MKISLNNIGPYRPDAAGFSRADVKKNGIGKDAGNFDAITIHSSSRQIQEKTFSETLARQISAEVRTGASQEKVEALKAQVAAGTYFVDPYAVAARITFV